MTTIEHGWRGRVHVWKGRLARLLPPRAALESPEDAKRAATRTKWAAFIIAGLALIAAAFHLYAVYAVGLLFALLAHGRSDWYSGWIAGHEARRHQHLRDLGQ